MGSWNEQLKKDTKQHYIFGIIAAVLMIVLGVVMIFCPVGSLRAILWLLVIGFLVAGIFRIVTYNRMPYLLRQGFSLATGVIDVILSLMLIVAMVSDPVATGDVFIWFIGFMFGFYALFAGINTIAGSGFVKQLGGSSGWLVASGILEIIAGVMLLFVPEVGTLFFMYLLGFTLIVCGISLFATSIDIKNRVKSLDDMSDRFDDEFDPYDPFARWRR
jgi:uncharacterized membrane protein HdeD (DUF308 family)